MERRKTRKIRLGSVTVGGGSPVSVQSMTNTPTPDVRATIAQIKALEKAGCEVVRVAVPDKDAAVALPGIKKGIALPLIADIHFDWRLALMAIEAGVDGLRLNPGNIGGEERVREVVRAAKQRGIPIRIGINSGSLEEDLLKRYGHPSPEAMVESALRHIRLVEDMDFFEIKVSLKASGVWPTINAYRLLARKVDYPFHVGVTEAGTLFSGTVKSSVGIGVLLSEGIGDTIRVSLTADPVEEVRVGWEILKALELRKRGVNVISCPTCGRIKIDCVGLASEVEKRLGHIKEPVNLSLMGCVVNGPGEAVMADVGIIGGGGGGGVGGDGVALLYSRGKVVRKVKEEEIVSAVIEEVESIVREREKAKNLKGAAED
ncbi:MAG: flavodoxin-dependent (E)-4-hydroxy-3-methylbut-2-enyl-diphosphate synthase [Deltaproteobacteria bacterium]|nr:flavodoxin-dependent (E)-4-hydroxy-3-methylbut-2-enyl-diphosphate synthase [Deltaproteobacteria bacterium]